MKRLLVTLMAVCASKALAQFEIDLTQNADARDKAAKPEAKTPPKAAEEVGLDLTATADVKAVLLLPPIVRVTQSQGGFSGFDTKKTFDKFDLASHKRFVASLQKQLGGKLVPAEATQGAMTKESFTPAQARTPAGLARLARVTNVGFVVTLDFNKTGSLVAQVHDVNGAPQGAPSYLTNAGGLSQKNADDLAPILGKVLIELSKEKPVEATPVAEVAPVPEEDVQDSPPPELVATPTEWVPDPDKARVTVAVGAGGVLRQLGITGEASGQLAELRNNGVVGVGVYAQVQPLQFVPALSGKRFSDLEVELHFRRAFVRATGVEGSAQGQSCSMTDDDLQVRGSYRVKVAEGTYAPFIGVGGGWAQERTLFDACTLPLLSASYRGFDAQLRIKQPLFRNVLALDVSAGPRFLSGNEATATRFSLAGEAWLEVKPVSVLFARAGVRASRLSAESKNLSVVETRLFFALEAGAFF